MFTGGIAEVKTRLRKLRGIAIRPKGEEQIAGVEWPPDIVVIARAVAGDLSLPDPRPTVIRRGPEAYLATAAIGLRTGAVAAVGRAFLPDQAVGMALVS